MSRFKSILAQILLWAGPVLNIWYPFIPPKALTGINLGLGTIAVIVAKKTSETNPDGTSAKAPWIP